MQIGGNARYEHGANQMSPNVTTLGEVADFGNEICQPCNKL
jgi:hypothetical protein